MTNSRSVQVAETLVNGFLSAGVKNFVASPGSRNGALSLALASASNENLVNLAIRIDERSAAFVALGMALKTKAPAVVVCTSGTAVANLLPALVEAKYSEVPLIAITADRPKDLINTGVSQTIDQENIFGKTTKLNLTLDSQAGDFTSWANDVEDLLNELAKNPQPAHINVHFSEPLIPSESFKFSKSGNFQLIKNEQIELPKDFINKKGLIIAGATFENLDSYVDELAANLKWPLVAEPPTLASVNKISHHPAVLAALPDDLQPEVLLTVGRVGLSRPTAKLIAGAKKVIKLNSPKVFDRIVGEVVTKKLAKLPIGDKSEDWIASWNEINHKAENAASNRKVIQPDLLQVVSNLFSNAIDKSHIHLSASLAARDFELMLTKDLAKTMAAKGITVSMNRGVNGIDGVVSTAFGLSLAEPERQHYCLLGDIAVLHDLSGFALPLGERPVNLHFVIVNNNGGGIFSTLEQAGVENFDRVYATMHGLEIDKVLAHLKVKEVNPGAKYEIKSAPGVSAQVFNVEPIEKVNDIREEVYSLIKHAIKED